MLTPPLIPYPSPDPHIPLHPQNTHHHHFQVIIVFADQAAADTASSSTTHSKGNMQSQCDTCWLGDAYDVELEGTLVIVGATVGQVSVCGVGVVV